MHERVESLHERVDRLHEGVISCTKALSACMNALRPGSEGGTGLLVQCVMQNIFLIHRTLQYVASPVRRTDARLGWLAPARQLYSYHPAGVSLGAGISLGYIHVSHMRYFISACVIEH